MTTATPSADDIRLHFAQLAMQYYVAGRAAAIHQLIPVLGNLLHHAVEMSLKAGLASSHSLVQLKGLGHRLPRLWEVFSAAFPSATGIGLQAAVDSLHRFEELRYPDSILANGAMMQFALHRSHVSDLSPSPGGVPSYVLVLEDVDELEEAIFAAMNLNPQFFSASLSPKAKEHLLLHNLHATRWYGDA
jgi:hypothetical protein